MSTDCQMLSDASLLVSDCVMSTHVVDIYLSDTCTMLTYIETTSSAVQSAVIVLCQRTSFTFTCQIPPQVATLVDRLLSGNSASYLTDDCRLVADAPLRLRSTESRTCVVTRTHSTFGDRAFAIWNSLPPHLGDSGLPNSRFRQSLKTFLFG